MATSRLTKCLSALKKSRKGRLLTRQDKESRRMHLERLEDRLAMALSPPVLVQSDSGTILNNNDTRNVAPRELNFTFVSVPGIDRTTLAGGISLVRAGKDGTFGDSNDVTIQPAYLDIGNSQTEVVMRFATTLPDDLYQVTFLGATLKDTDGFSFNSGQNYSLNFKLDLGAQVLAVVPQPVTRNAGGSLAQALNRIDVYFNDDTLHEASAENPQFYRLLITKATVDPGDDGDAAGQEIVPISVDYDPVLHKSVLTFAAPLHQLVPDDGSADPAKAFRLRIGTSETRRPNAAGTIGGEVTVDWQTSDPGSSFATAVNLGNAITGGVQGTSIAIGQSISAQPYALTWPGTPNEPGHRRIAPDAHQPGLVALVSPPPTQTFFTGSDGPEDHYGNLIALDPRVQAAATPDSTDGVTTYAYNFRDEIGFIPDGTGGTQPAFNLITENQKQRAREALEMIGRYAGVKFIETEQQGFIIATGDIRAVLPTTLTGPAGAAGNVTSLAGAVDVDGDGVRETAAAVMDNAEIWADTLGGNWFINAMHQLNTLFGLGHTYDLPGLTVQGQDPALQGTSPAPEPVFPGDADIVHLQNLYRPDSKDIDLYRFTLDATGVFTAQTFAERLANSSGLDSYITLYKVEDSGPVLIARNDDYFSQDSYLQLTLGAGTYFIGVSAAGNDKFDPTIADSGIGGTSQGAYELKIDFRKAATSSIIDTTGTSLDGDGDGDPTGVNNFWFRAAAPRGQELAGKDRTLFVDRTAAAGGNGSLALPYNNIQLALNDAEARSAIGFSDIVRIVGNNLATTPDTTDPNTSDNLAYQIGFDQVSGLPLRDGSNLNVPKNVTVMIDAGATFQMRRSQISVGSTAPSASADRSGGALQVLGTPFQSIYFTTFNEQSGTGITTIGKDENPLTTTPADGDWGGLSFTHALDRADGRFDWERRGVFLDYVSHADIRYGGGQVVVDSVPQVVNPIHMTSARPTVINNRITLSSDAAMSANPDSFEETDFQGGQYASSFSTTFNVDYRRVGPDIHGNLLLNNSINGLFVRAQTPAGDVLEELTVAGRFDDTDIVHVLQENLIIRGTPGGATQHTVLTAPPVTLVVATQQVGGGNFNAGTQVEYRLTYVDLAGNEGLASDTITLLAPIVSNGSSVLLDNLPQPDGDFIARRLYRRVGGVGNFVLVDQVAGTETSYLDRNLALPATPLELKVGAVEDPAIPPVATGSPAVSTVIFSQTSGSGSFAPGANVVYAMTYVDTEGRESPLARVPGSVTVTGINSSIRLSNLPATPGQYIGLRIYRAINGGQFDLVGLADARTTTFTDTGAAITGTVVPPTQNVAVSTDLPIPAFPGFGFFQPGDRVNYRMSFGQVVGGALISQGPSTAVPDEFVVGTGALDSLIRLNNLPPANAALFNSLILWRSVNGSRFEGLFAIPAGSGLTTIVDSGAINPLSIFLDDFTPAPAATSRARLDASLVIDPSIIVKAGGARIDVGIGANLIAEGVTGLPVVFTSLQDERFGAGGTFETTNDPTRDRPLAGDWAGIYFNPDASGSIDNALFSYAGGLNRIEGTFTGINTVEIRQADVRIANSRFEFNGPGTGGSAPADRFGRGANEDATIFIRGAQPVIINNVAVDNRGAYISINVNALTSDSVVDTGRQSGLIDLFGGNLSNNGPLIRGNLIDRNEINGLRVRGGVVTTESVWDDTDIAHVLFDTITIPDFHTKGGVRLKSAARESLVVKSSGATAGFVATGRPLEIEDRIGGTLQVLGQPGFPVVLTSFSDDSTSAGKTPDGRAQSDTNGDLLLPPLPTGPEVDAGTLIDNDVTPNTTPGFFSYRVGNAGSNGAPPGAASFQGAAALPNQQFINQYLPYVDVGLPGGAISLAATTITSPPTLISSDVVASEGTFAGPNGPILWRAETSFNNGATTLANRITFTAGLNAQGVQTALGDVRLLNYFDPNMLVANDDFLYMLGSPGQSGFRVAILDGAQRIGFGLGGVYTAGPGLVNAKYLGFSADNTPVLQNAITGAAGLTNLAVTPITTGTTPNVPPATLPAFVDAALGTVYGPNNVTAAMGWSVAPAAESATITTFLDVLPRTPVNNGRPGEWAGLTIGQYANDRNVETALERENPTSDGSQNAVPEKAQFLGGLATSNKGGDENLRLGFTTLGMIAQPGDVDVYSFQATAGTEVWIDLDQTAQALDSVVELIDNNGIVLARSNNSPAEAAGTEPLFGIARPMNKTAPYQGQDFNTVNTLDAGMRVLLPGPPNTLNTYFVRVRSNSGLAVNEITQGRSGIVTELVPGGSARAIELMRASSPLPATIVQGASGTVAEVVKGGSSFSTEVLRGGGPTITTSIDGNSAVVSEVIRGGNTPATELLRGGSLAVTTQQQGGGGNNEQQRVLFSTPPSGGTFTLTFGGQTTLPIAVGAPALTVQNALTALSNIGAGNVTVAAIANGYTVTFVGALANQNVAQMTATASELQRVTNPVPANAFTLSFAGQTTTALAGNATALQVQTALEALSNIAPGDVTVSGIAGGPYDVQFGGAYANVNVAPLAVNDREVQRVALAGPPTGGTFTLAFNGQTTLPIAYNASPAVVQAALEALPTIGVGNVAVSGGAGSTWDVTFRGALALQNVVPLVARVNEVQSFFLAGNPTAGSFQLSFGALPTSALPFNATAAAVQAALEAIATIGVGNVAVVQNGSVYTVTFRGALANTNVVALTGSSSEMQHLENPVATGALTLGFNGQVTATLPANATAAQVEAALEALSNIAPGDIAVAAGGVSGFDVTFLATGAYGNQNVNQIAVLTTEIMRGGGPAITTAMAGGSGAVTESIQGGVSTASEVMRVGGPTVTTFQEGGGGIVNESQLINFTLPATGGTFTLSFGGNTTIPIPFNATGPVVQAALEALPSIGAGNVLVFGTGDWGVIFQGALGGINVAQLTASANEFQRVIAVVPGNDFTLTFNGQTTALIPGNADPTVVQTALEALANIGPGNVAVTGPVGGPWDVEFRGIFAGTDVAALVIGQDETQTVDLTSGPTGGTFTLSFQNQTTAAIDFDVTAAALQTALEAVPTIGVGNVVVTGTAGGPWDVRFTGTLARQDVPALVIRVNEVQQIDLQTISGSSFTLTFNGQTTSALPFNATPAAVQTALEGLGSIGAGNVAVTQSGGVYSVTFQGSLANADVPQLTGTADEIQRVVAPFPGSPFNLNFDGQITASIATGATAAQVQAALEALINIAPGDVFVTGAAGGPWDVRFSGVYANQDVPQMLYNDSEVQRISLAASPAGATFSLTFNGQNTGTIPVNASAAQVQTALEGLANIAPGDVLVTGNAGGPWDVAFRNTYGSQDVAPLVVGVNELQSFSLQGPPSGGAFTLTFSGQTTGLIPFNATASDVQLALEALGNVAPGDVQVTFAAGTWFVEFTGAYANQDVPALTGSSNEFQRIVSPVVGGALTLSFNGQVTSLLPPNATALQVQTALEALSNIAPGDIVVTGPAGGPYDVEFRGVYANVNVPEIRVLDAQVMQAGAPAISTQTQGGGGLSERQVVSLLNGPVGGAFTLTFSGQTTAAIPFNATPAQVQTALAALSNIGAGNVSVTGPAGGPWSVLFGGTLANLNLPQMTGNSNEFQRVTTAAPGAAFVLTFNGQTTATIPANATALQVQAALEALSNIGVGDVAVTGVPGGPYDVEFKGVFANQDVAAMAIGQDETQRVAITPAAGAGTFTLSFQGQTTAPLPVAATAAQVQAALQGLSTIGAGNVVVTGSPGGPWDVQFTGVFTLQDVASLSVQINEIQRFNLQGTPSAGTFTLSFNGQTTAPIAYNASALDVQNALIALANIAPGDVVVTPGPNNIGYEVAFQGAYANQNVVPITGNVSGIVGGLTDGAYRMQIRLREQDEVGGTTVRFAKIVNAVNGITVLGGPSHSPLGGERSETNDATNNAFAGAQLLGNVLSSDRGALSLAGNLSNVNDVDWFQITVNYTNIEGANPVPAEITSLTALTNLVFDLDYADGKGGPNAAIYVFDNTGRLVLTSRDSNVADDRPAPTTGSGISDLTRGSVGTSDPYIGNVALPSGTPSTASRVYFVAIASDAQSPQALNQFFAATAANPQLKLEPLSSVKRIVEDHLNEGTFAAPINTPRPPPASAPNRGTSQLPDVELFIDPSSEVPYNLGDVVLYAIQDDPITPLNGINTTRLITIDPFTGAQETIVNGSAVPWDTADLALRDNTRLYALSRDIEDTTPFQDSTSGQLYEIDPATGAGTLRGDDGIVTYEEDKTVPRTIPPTTAIANLFNGTRVGYGIQYNAATYGDIDENGTDDRLFAVGNRGETFFTAVGGNPTVTTVTQGSAGGSEVQNVTLSAATTAFTLTFNGQTTALLAFNAPAATVRAALEALSTIGTGNVVVTAIANGFQVTFAGTLANTNVNQMTGQSFVTSQFVNPEVNSKRNILYQLDPDTGRALLTGPRNPLSGGAWTDAVEIGRILTQPELRLIAPTSLPGTTVQLDIQDGVTTFDVVDGGVATTFEFDAGFDYVQTINPATDVGVRDGYFFILDSDGVATGDIVSATVAAGIVTVTTAAAHGLTNNMVVDISGVAGGTNINATDRTVTVLNATQFSYASAGATGPGAGGTFRDSHETNANATIFQFDTGPSILVDLSATAAGLAGQVVTINFGGVATNYEFTVVGSMAMVAMGNVEVQLAAASTSAAIAAALANAINARMGGGGTASIAAGSSRISLIPTAPAAFGSAALSAGIGTRMSIQGETGRAPVLQAIPDSATVPLDGKTFTLTNAGGTTVFEFDTNGVSGSPANQTVVVPALANATTVANLMAQEIRAFPGNGASLIKFEATQFNDKVMVNGQGIGFTFVAGQPIINLLDLSVANGGLASQQLISAEESFDNQLIATALTNAVNNQANGFTAGGIGNPTGTQGRINFPAPVQPIPPNPANRQTTLSMDADGMPLWGPAVGTPGTLNPSAIPIPFLAQDDVLSQIGSRVVAAINSNLSSFGISASQDGSNISLSRGTFSTPTGSVLSTAGQGPGGDITGIVDYAYGRPGGTPTTVSFLAISSNGGLFDVTANHRNNSTIADNNPAKYGGTTNSNISITYLQDSAADLQGINFQALVRGPQAVENGKYQNIWFAIAETAQGSRVYAFSWDPVSKVYGGLQPIFVNGATSTLLYNPVNGNALIGIRGLAFSNLDSNLWNITPYDSPTNAQRQNDVGHGVSAVIDGSRTTDIGHSSIHFGRGVGNNYAANGGSYGSMVTNEFSLEGYSSFDQPVLYFNYFLNADSSLDIPNPPTGPVYYDTFRVFISGVSDDNRDRDVDGIADNNSGDWIMISHDDNLTTNDPLPGVRTWNQANAGTSAGWRQARIPLDAFAGMENLRLRIDFTTSGDMNVGDLNTTGEELRGVAGEYIADGQFVSIDGTIFEFDSGDMFTVPSGGAIRDGERLVINGVTFEFDKDQVTNVLAGSIPIRDYLSNIATPPPLSETMSAADVMENILIAVKVAGLGSTLPQFVRNGFINQVTTDALGRVTVDTVGPHGLVTGDRVTITGVTGTTPIFANINGGLFTVTVIDATHFRYTNNGVGAGVGGIWSTPRAGLINQVSATDGYVTVTTTVPHGLNNGDQVNINGVGGVAVNGGPFRVSVIDATRFTYYLANTNGVGFGGTWDSPRGVSGPEALRDPATADPAHPNGLIRDNRLQFPGATSVSLIAAPGATATALTQVGFSGVTPSSAGFVSAISSVNGLVTITTNAPHGLRSGARVTIAIPGIPNVTGPDIYNGTFTVSVVDPTRFVYTLAAVPNASVGVPVPAAPPPFFTWSSAAATPVPFDILMFRDEVANSLEHVAELSFYDQKLLTTNGSFYTDGETFTLTNQASGQSATFEFNSGYLMNVPINGSSAAGPVTQRVLDGETFTLTFDFDGAGPQPAVTRTFQFDTNNNFTPAPGVVRVQVVNGTQTQSQSQVAQTIVSAINNSLLGTQNPPLGQGALGLTARVVVDSVGNLRVQLDTQARNVTFSTSDPAKFSLFGDPFVTGANIPVIFSPTATFAAGSVSTAIVNAINNSSAGGALNLFASFDPNAPNRLRLTSTAVPNELFQLTASPAALPLSFEAAVGSTGLVDTFKVNKDLVRLIRHSVDVDPITLLALRGPLGHDVALPGDEFGNYSSTNRARNNAAEGVYVDDFIIGLAERGEMVSGNPVNNTFVANPQLSLSQTLVGDYQVEIRRGAGYEFVTPDSPGFTNDTNDRFVQQYTLTAPRGSNLLDGQTFTLYDGKNRLTFEFNDNAAPAVNGTFVAPGNQRINFNAGDTDEIVARAIRDAINSLQVQSTLAIQASMADGSTPGTATTTNNQVNLVGAASFVVEGVPAVESNDTLATAIPTNFNGAQYFANGTIGDNPASAIDRATAGQDVDLYSIILTAGQKIRVDIDAATFNSTLDSILRIFDATGAQATLVNGNPAVSDDNPAPAELANFDSYLEFVAPAAGTYYIGVSGFSNRLYNPVDGTGAISGTTGTYQLEITSALPSAIPATIFDETKGDKNLERDQGQIILQSNEIVNSQQFGIRVDSGARIAAEGLAPHQGPVRTLAQTNTARLVPGVVIENNVIYGGLQGGIFFSGDPAADAPVPFGRIVNNTLYGGGGTLAPASPARVDTGIQITENAGPTLLNNIVVNFTNGITVDATSAPNTVVGGSTFQGNTNNSNVPGSFTQLLPNNAALFTNAAGGIFYLRSGALPIDSSVDSLLDRTSLVTVRNPLGLAQSPIIAPDRDNKGQVRLDDPSVAPAPGQGLNPFKDRGAIDRVDNTGPGSTLLNPLDNDAAGLDRDPTVNTIVLDNVFLRDFTISLIDLSDPNGDTEGSDIDDFTVSGGKIRVFASDGIVTTELAQGVDYTFSYDATSNIVRINPKGNVWPLSTTYIVTLDSTITDQASNPLAPNHITPFVDPLDANLTYLHYYTIFLGSAVDFGDAPDTYGTLNGSNGPSHQITGNFFLGSNVSADPDGKPTANADLDNFDDGITFGNLQVGGGPDSSQLFVTASAPGKLDAWFDLDDNGMFDPVTEYILQGIDLLGNGLPEDVRFQLPTGLPNVSFARFRFSTDGINTPTGPAADGEVEDYQVTLVGPQYQNSVNNLDVNNDGLISPIDALLAINFVNYLSGQLITPGGNLPLPVTSPPYLPSTPPIDQTGGGVAGQGRYLDVNGDGFLSSIDALIVINYLNNPQGSPEGEGEGEAAPLFAASSLSAQHAASRDENDPAIPAMLLAGPSIEYGLRSTNSSPAAIAASTLQDQQSDQLGLALLALDQAGRDADRHGLRLAEVLELQDKLPYGPLSETSWDDLLSGLAFDQDQSNRNPAQVR